MELGNNSGTIIEPDADLSAAVPRCVMSAFANSGQVCISLQRLYVHKAIAKEFTKRFVEETKKLKVGKPAGEGLRRGPDDRGEGGVRAEEWVKEAGPGGAKVLIGGKREGRVMQPTVLVNVRTR